ncbi:MAG: hypothetical protein AB7F40_11405 [Victivallaceae bacterium]
MANSELMIPERPLVTTAVERGEACDLLKEVKSRIAAVKAHYAPMKEKALAAHKQVCAQEKDSLAPLLDGESKLKDAIVAFDDAEERRIAAERERQRIEADKLAVLAEEATAAGDDDTACEAVALAASCEVSYTPQAQTQGISSRKVWTATVTDREAAIRSLLAVGMGYMLVIDNSALQAWAKSSKGRQSLVGIMVEEKSTLSVRVK